MDIVSAEPPSVQTTSAHQEVLLLVNNHSNRERWNILAINNKSKICFYIHLRCYSIFKVTSELLRDGIAAHP
jgi:hypothetical protein